MRKHWWVLWCVLASISSVALTCGPTVVVPTCDSTNCDGCCQGNTCVAVANQTATSCGRQGAVCAGCSASQHCEAGECHTSSSSCTAATCPNGCCAGSTCVTAAALSASQCGTAGAACRVCGGAQECISGVCQTQSVCNSTTCPDGCCANGACIASSGQTNQQCGRAGNECGTCQNNESCRSGVCASNPTCSAATCAGGCCNASGECVGAAVQTAQVCGTNGATCAKCGANQSCTSGQCTTCDATTCPNGCCTALGVCLSGTSLSKDACGKGGAACGVCISGKICKAGACVTPQCNTSSCDGGCCDANDQCISTGSQSSQACGTHAQACQACEVGTICQRGGAASGQCVSNPCNPSLCPSGCCGDDGSCLRPGFRSQTVKQCGPAGGAFCKACAATLACVYGECVTPAAPPACNSGFAGCTTFEDRTVQGASRVIVFQNPPTPACIQVKIGQTLRWDGPTSTHPLAQACGPAQVFSKPVTSGPVDVQFSVAGDYGYYCTSHGSAGGAGMAGVIRVVP